MMFVSRFVLVALAAVTVTASASDAAPLAKPGNLKAALHVCGNYCGPAYCNAQYLPEVKCDDSVEVETWKLSGPSCADSCCRAHDTCCGHGDRSSCNTKIVNCLAECNKLSGTCTLDGVPVPASSIEGAMYVAEDWCCGKPCSKADLEAGEIFRASPKREKLGARESELWAAASKAAETESVALAEGKLQTAKPAPKAVQEEEVMAAEY